MQNNHSILELVDKTTSTIFWFTDKSISRASLGFEDLNYIFDGLISQVISESNENSNRVSQVFMTKNFNKQLCLIHFKSTNAQSSDLDEQIAFLTSSGNSYSEILVLDYTNLEWREKLSKRYPQFKFYGHAQI